ncbi:hypothetical protein R3P38DRAFT_2798725 [Favolaschia claudopus]|uniref:DUF6533 domain-containing protein n=1 Tax=Favolaschia claudopus TaxID=2862362 RepID=A0AAV9Z4M4_9AGAR
MPPPPALTVNSLSQCLNWGGTYFTALPGAAASVVTYDYFLTVSDEVDFVWNHRLGLPKVVFFLSRYLLPATELNWPCSGLWLSSGSRQMQAQSGCYGCSNSEQYTGRAQQGCSTEMPYPGLASGSWLTFSVMHVDNYSPFQLQDKPINLSRPTAVAPCIARCKLMKSSGGVSHDYQSFEDGNEQR